MWRFTSVAAPAIEPVSLSDARRQCNLLPDETEFDGQLGALILVARNHIEVTSGLYFGSRAVTVSSGVFSDLARLPVAPVTAVTSLSYTDAGGVEQEIPSRDYVLANHDQHGIEQSITPPPGERWPAAPSGARIILTVQAGFDPTPPDVQHAMLMWIDQAFRTREPTKVDGWTTLDSLLCNYRRGA
ncbi:hypothetical protein V5F44_11155 [Xanthobacter sp. V2C-8]|uniref:head-tail connector protein n=1 Tax=Xanthobacter albus TaxID=3119929 RepID=UPI00372786FF